jgi:serine protease Do
MSPELAQTLRRSSVEVRSGKRGSGTGVIWSADGRIVTNAHVIGRRPVVKLSDGREFQAEVKRHDPERDLALLQINAEDLPAAAIGDSSHLRVGQIVAATGNPLGVTGAVTTGIIHATGERWFIQADVRLAPGNSGGMLADVRGRVIGINTMIYAGLALAIPSNTAAAFARGENIDRPLLGITMQPVDLKGALALVILHVEPGSLADRHGLMLGDVLLLSQPELRDALESGGTVLLRYLRGNDVREATITLPARTEAQAA